MGGLFGVVIGDALGFPVQFLTREYVKNHPVTDMVYINNEDDEEYPPGIWSDDSSLTLCLARSLADHGYNIIDIAQKFVDWYKDGYMTPRGKAFDIGHTTRRSIERLMNGIKSPLMSGDYTESSNGNGSLMRILPVSLYCHSLEFENILPYVYAISSITHAHPRSRIGCGIYSMYAQMLLKGDEPSMAYDALSHRCSKVFSNNTELEYYSRILGGSLPNLPEKKISSSGYVVSTLEAAMWCFLNTTSFKECVLKAVNLGNDADTVGAVAGGLAGIYYGYDSIPTEWLMSLQRRDLVAEVICNFTDICIRKNGEE